MGFPFFLISFLASVAGSVCGIGGGVIIKPILDLFQIASVSTISFLSGCTVLSMSGYSISKALCAKDRQIDLKIGTPLAIGAAIGGVTGKQLFSALISLFPVSGRVGAIQALCLFFVTFGTLLYTINRDRIRTIQVYRPIFCVLIGVALGMLSSFLGIGGGPINLVVLYFFFSMETKTAAQNSLYIIFFSQTSSLLITLASHTVPTFELSDLTIMMIGGILGGMIGRKLYLKMHSLAVTRIFIWIMLLIMLICAYNSLRYFNVFALIHTPVSPF